MTPVLPARNPAVRVQVLQGAAEQRLLLPR